MAATSTAYGSCVDTWFIWLHWAPADAMMVVSDIGEQWSPHTAPAMHAEIEMIIIVWFVPEKMFTTIGMSMPKVPHEVPVAKARKAPTTNMIAGNSPRSGPDTPPTKPATNSLAPRLSVMVFSVHAKVSISIAGTIALKPSGIELQQSVKLSTLLIE